MNTDIRLSVNFFTHPKTVKLERQLGLDGVVSLLRLWLWAVQNRPSGALTGMDDEDIEIVSGWPGDSGAFIRAIVALRLLDLAEATYHLHDWQEHNPWQAEAEDRADKARFSRLRQVCPEAFERLKNSGTNAISKAEYVKLTSRRSAGDRQATAEEMPSDTPATAGASLASRQLLSSPCLSSPYHAEEGRESSLRSDSLSGPSVPDVTACSPSEAVQKGTLRKKQAKKQPAEFPKNSEAYQLAVVMRNTLKANVPTLKEPDLQKWAQCFDVAMRNDDRMKDASFVAQVIAWACSDSFWRANIQSPGKLREKFDQLTAKMETEAAKRRNSPQAIPWKSPAQRRFEANQQAGREAKRLLFGEQEVREYRQ